MLVHSDSAIASTVTFNDPSGSYASNFSHRYYVSSRLLVSFDPFDIVTDADINAAVMIILMIMIMMPLFV